MKTPLAYKTSPTREMPRTASPPTMKNTTPKPLLFACVLALALCSFPKVASAQNPPNLTPSQVQQIFQNAEAGDAEAQTKLGFMYEKGLGVAKDDKLAIQWYQKAAKQGNTTAQSNLRLIYQKAAEAGDAVAQTKLGFMYEKGLGVAKDDKLAIQWYQKAAKQGNTTGQTVWWTQRAAEQGHPAAQYDLAQMHVEGRWVCPSYELAVHWYERAALQGHPAAQYELGLIYHKGARGVPRNYKLARQWFSKLAEQAEQAEQGDARVQYYLGHMHEKGLGVPRNYKLAAQWYHKAAKGGEIAACDKLGHMYEKGQGMSRDAKQAYIWLSISVGNGVKSSKSLYEKIARRLLYQHNIKAQANIGLMYKNGEGLPKDYVQAYAWFSVAFANGEASAKALGDAVAQKLSPQQREAAQSEAASIQKSIDSRTNKAPGSKKLWK